MSYRANVSNKEQDDIERAMDDSAIRIFWFDGKQGQVGETKFVRAYDINNQANTGNTGADQVKQFGHIIGQHNDKPSIFETPGRR